MPISKEYLQTLLERFQKEQSGRIADYIPELSKASADHFAIAYVDTRGRTLAVGDFDKKLTLQSLSKPFIYGLALREVGEQAVHNKVGVEPTGDAFNSIIELEEQSHRPFNPMINSGAIATTSLIYAKTKDSGIDFIARYLSEFVQHPVAIEQNVYLSEKATGHRNRAIAHLMKNFGILEGDVESSLDLYFQQCSLLMSSLDIAWLGACLANGGVHPTTGHRILSREHVKHILSLMMTCGMYDSSGRWVFEVGLPAKSGVSGVIVAVLPNQGAIAVSSPPLDQHGHSVRGVRVIEQISKDLSLNMFMPRAIHE